MTNINLGTHPQNLQPALELKVTPYFEDDAWLVITQFKPAGQGRE
jgi:hypothetical protein